MEKIILQPFTCKTDTIQIGNGTNFNINSSMISFFEYFCNYKLCESLATLQLKNRLVFIVREQKYEKCK